MPSYKKASTTSLSVFCALTGWECFHLKPKSRKKQLNVVVQVAYSIYRNNGIFEERLDNHSKVLSAVVSVPIRQIFSRSLTKVDTNVIADLFYS